MSWQVGKKSNKTRPSATRWREAVDGFDVALVGVGGGRDADVLAGTQGGGKAGGVAAAVVGADELDAAVGLPDQMTAVDATAAEVVLDALGGFVQMRARASMQLNLR